MKLRFQGILLFIVAAMLSACGSTSAVRQNLSVQPGTGKYEVGTVRNTAANPEVQAPEHFVSAIKGHLKAELARRNIAANDTAAPTHKINIDINNYRMRSGFTRMMFGMFAGKDGVASNIAIIDRSGKVVGQTEVSTYNVMAVGGEDDVARMHAEEIAKYLGGGK